MKPITVTIFEDNKHLRESLGYLINGTAGFGLIDAFPDGYDLLPRLDKNLPDVVLMDIEMPGLNGIEAVKLIKQQYPAVQILMQTIFHDDDNIFNAVCAGASGYILKTTSPEGYLEAIRDVHNGGSPMTGSVARRVLELFQHNLIPKGNADYQLTPREKEILQQLIKGKSYKMIADAVGCSFETVRSHMKNIYVKLHVNSNTEAVLKVLQEKIV